MYSETLRSVMPEQFEDSPVASQGLSLLKRAAALGFAVYIWRKADVHGRVGSFASVIWNSHLVQSKLRSLKSAAMSTHMVTHLNAGIRREIQASLKFIPTSVPPTHSHREAAMERNSATETMLAAVRSMGLDPYVVSGSPRESTEDGSRLYYTLADLSQRFRESPIKPTTVFIMTDVDYYVDMHALLSYHRPILLYTFQPEKVAGKVKNGFFTIEDDIVDYRVTGGKTVRHRVWDYNQDVVATRDVDLSWWEVLCSAFMTAIGIKPWIRGTVSHIDQFALSEHRRIVAIVPFASVKQPVLKAVTGATLRRARYSHGVLDKVNYLVHVSEEGPIASVGVQGELATAELSLERLEQVKTAHGEATATHLSDTVRRSKLDPGTAATLHRFIRTSKAVPMEVHKPGQLARHYICVTNEDQYTNRYDVGAEYAREFAPGPLTATAVFPSDHPANSKASIEGRVTMPQQSSGRALRINPRFNKYAREFTDHVVGDHVHSGRPWTVEQVVQKQDRPTQRVRSAQRDMDWDENFQVLAFQKREAYNCVNHPRNISTVTTTHTLRLSSFTYAFKAECLKDKKWYAPGKTPEEIAAAVMRLAANNDSLVQSDFSRFDGWINEWLRVNVEFPCYMRWVHSDERAELRDLLFVELNPKARTKLAGKYDAGCSRLSGSPLTTDGNTIINAFSAYAAAREEGHDPKDALLAIGLAYGDDGMRAGFVPDQTMIRTAKFLGLNLAVEKRSTPGESISFLSRLFLDPWTTPASVQSPKRTLLKLHTTTDRVKPIVDMGVAKVSGYLVTDGKTPFVSDWCEAYLRCAAREATTTTTDDSPWWVRDVEFRASPWPQDSYTSVLHLVAEDLEVGSGELLEHITALRNYNGPISGMPRLAIPASPAKVDAVLDGEVHHAGASFVETHEPVSLQDQVSQQDGVSPDPQRHDDFAQAVRGPTRGCPGHGRGRGSRFPRGGTRQTQQRGAPSTDGLNHRPPGRGAHRTRGAPRRVNSHSTR
uniref:RNA replicase n=1 Tax=Wenling noda-like virus 2 TaxID=1923512 RepID=A0A1L3KH01_9VIRU|nr:hypothetical protein [Wenling noda-like virus 2]